VVGELELLLARQLEGSALGQNVFHPADDAADVRLVQPPTRGEVEERALLAPVLRGQQDLIFARQPGRSPRFTPRFGQPLGDEFDHALECFRFDPAVALEVRGAQIFDLFVAHRFYPVEPLVASVT